MKNRKWSEMTIAPIALGRLMLTSQNQQRVHSDAQVAARQTSWSSLPLNNGNEEETLFVA